MTQNLEVALALKIAQTGLENIAAVTRELAAAGVETAAFEQEAQQLADAMNAVSQQQKLVDQFVDLKAKTNAAATALEQAQQKTRDLALALKDTENPTKKQTAEFERARQATRDAADACQENRLKLQDLRGTMTDAGLSSSNLAQHQIDLKRTSSELATAANTLTQTMQASADQVGAYRKEHETLASAATESAATLASASTSYGKSTQAMLTQLQAAGADVAQLEQEVAALGGALDDAGRQQAMISSLQSLQAVAVTSKTALAAAEQQVADLQAAFLAADRPTLEQAQALEQAEAAATQMTVSYRQTESVISRLTTELQQSGVETTDLAAAQLSLRDTAVLLNSEQQSLNQRLTAEVLLLDQAGAATQNLTADMDALAQLAADRDLLGLKQHLDIQKEIDATRAAYERLKNSGTLTSAELAQAAQKTENRIRELKSETNGWSDSLDTAAASFAGLLAAGAGLVTVASQAIQFESAMSDVKKVVTGTDAQMSALSLRIRELSTELPISADGLAQIAAAGGQLGIPIEKLELFIQLSAKMATAFNLTADEAGQAVAKLANVFNLPIEQVAALGDAINVLGNTTAAREADILDVLTRVGGTASQFGLTAQQTAALATAFVSLGVGSDVAGTSINAILSKLQTVNVQGPEFQRALELMGISAKQLAADIQDNPQLALTTFLKTLEQLDGQARAEILSKLFGAEYQDDVARLLSGLNQYDAALARVSDSGATAGAMQNELNTRLTTTESQLQLLKNGTEAAAINLGSIFLPALRDVVTVLGNAAAGVAEFVDKNPSIAAVASAVATVTLAFGALHTVMLTVSATSAQAFASMTASIRAANLSMTALVAQVGVLSAALKTAAGVAAAAWIGWEIGSYLSREFEVVRKAGILLAEQLTELAAIAKAAWKIITNPGDIKKTLTDLDAALKQIKSTYADMYKEVGKVSEAQVDGLTAVEIEANRVRDAFNKMYNELPQHEKAAIDSTLALSGAWQTLGVDASEAMDKVTEGAGNAVAAAKIIQDQMISTGATATAQAAAIELAWSAAIPVAKTSADIELMRSKLVELANSGQLSADGLRRLNAALEDQAVKLNAARPAVSALEQAYQRLGVTSQESLQKTADQAGRDFETIRTGGTATADDISAAFLAYAEKAIAANNGVADAELRVEAARNGMLGQLQELIDKQKQAGDAGKEAGDKTADGARKARAATQELADSTQQVARDVQGLTNDLGAWFRGIRSEMQQLSAEAGAMFDSKLGINSGPILTEVEAIEAGMQKAREQLASLSRDNLQVFDVTGINKWKNSVLGARDETVIAYSQQRLKFEEYLGALQDGENINQRLINGARNAIQNMNLLGAENLATLRSALSSATAQLQQMSDSATDTLSSLRQELYSLRGETEKLQTAQYNQRKAELEAALAEAQAAGNKEAIAAYKEALSTLAEIRKEQKAQASADAATASTAATSSSSSGSSSSSSASTTTAAASASSSTNATTVVKTIKIELAGYSAEVLASDESDLLAILEAAANRSN